jgi:hypothetical protein
MPTNFPTSLDNFTNPIAGATRETTEVALHTNHNDAIEALEAKVGVNDSAVTTSLDYRVNFVEDFRRLPYMLAASNAEDKLKNIADDEADGSGDQIKIHEMRDAIPALKGGELLLSHGKFDITDMVIWNRANAILRGMGAPERRASESDDHNTAGTALVVNATNSFSTDEWILTLQDLDNPTTVALSHPTLRDFSIDGSDITAITLNGLLIMGYRSLIERVNVWRCSGRYVETRAAGSFNAYETNLVAMQVGKSPAGAGSGNCAYYMSSSDCVMTRCQSSDVNGSAVVIAGGGHQIYNSHFTGHKEHGVHLISGNTTKIQGCKIENSQKHGVYLDNTADGILYTQINNCGIRGSSQVTANTYSHVFFESAGTEGIVGTQITGCLFAETTASTNNVKYAVEINSTDAQRTNVENNIFDYSANMSTGVIYDNASTSHPTVISDNNGQPGATVGSYVVRASGTATVLNATTSIAVTFTNALSDLGPRHQPALHHLRVIPTNNLGNASHWWITSLSRTGFTINVDVDPGATTATFSYGIDIED